MADIKVSHITKMLSSVFEIAHKATDAPTLGNPDLKKKTLFRVLTGRKGRGNEKKRKIIKIACSAKTGFD